MSPVLLPRFDYAAPTSLHAAHALLADAGDARLLAGGTDLLVQMRRGVLRPRLLVSLASIPGLAALDLLPDGGFSVGPLVTMARLAAAPALAGPFAALAEGAGVVGGPLVHNRATVGGNVITARPCADTVAPLVTLGARLRLEGARGGRVTELDGFISGPGETGLQPGEILVGLELPAPPPRSGSCYLKVTRRAAMEVTVVGCAASVTLDEAGAVARVRLVLTSVAPVPLRVRPAETALQGAVPTPERIGAAAALARDAARPIDDHRAPGAYRREVTLVLARRALTRALARAAADAAAEVGR